MIRFTLGVIALFIGVGTMDASPHIINHGLVLSLAGLGLMIWALPKIQKQYDELQKHHDD